MAGARASARAPYAVGAQEMLVPTHGILAAPGAPCTWAHSLSATLTRRAPFLHSDKRGEDFQLHSFNNECLQGDCALLKGHGPDSSVLGPPAPSLGLSQRDGPEMVC